MTKVLPCGCICVCARVVYSMFFLMKWSQLSCVFKKKGTGKQRWRKHGKLYVVKMIFICIPTLPHTYLSAWYVVHHREMQLKFRVFEKYHSFHVSGCCMDYTWDILAHQTSSWLPSCCWSLLEPQHRKYYWVHQMQQRCTFSCTASNATLLENSWLLKVNHTIPSSWSISPIILFWINWSKVRFTICKVDR